MALMSLGQRGLSKCDMGYLGCIPVSKWFMTKISHTHTHIYLYHYIYIYHINIYTYTYLSVYIYMYMYVNIYIYINTRCFLLRILWGFTISKTTSGCSFQCATFASTGGPVAGPASCSYFFVKNFTTFWEGVPVRNRVQLVPINHHF